MLHSCCRYSKFSLVFRPFMVGRHLKQHLPEAGCALEALRSIVRVYKKISLLPRV